MGASVIAENIGKKYLIGHQRIANYSTLRDKLAYGFSGLGRRVLHPLSPNGNKVELEEFWALRNISFEIGQGERVGIIGRNGAGKSTLLKILSRITEPTEGRVRMFGRVASLLEVGTGFHPELSGRENIFLNGSILGMKKAEISDKFDEIVDFSGIEKFLDTPVKRYSSGMYVRLAFAVAAHLEPDILIVDEVLAVGDAQFQNKCIGKLEEAGSEGRTILFVSHNMGMMERLCNKGLFIENGLLKLSGGMSGIMRAYIGNQPELNSQDLSERKDRSGSGPVRATGITILDAVTLTPVTSVSSGQGIVVEVAYEGISPEPDVLDDLKIVLNIFDTAGNRITKMDSQVSSGGRLALPRNGKVYCRVPDLPLRGGYFSLNINLWKRNILSDSLKDAATFMVHDGDYFNSGILDQSSWQGVYLRHSWSTVPADEGLRVAPGRTKGNER